MFVISNHSCAGSVFGFGMISVITRLFIGGLTIARRLPPSSHMPGGVNIVH